jgi:galactokinase
MASLREQFQQSFGRPAAVVTCAPGRVEFIGNHTDYNGGAVIGAAIDRGVQVAAGPAPAGHFRVRSTSGATPLDFTSAPPVHLAGASAWGNYVFGVWHSLRDFSQSRPAGFDLLVDSDLPAGAGLSSSAALELATALALLAVAKSPPLSAELLALLGRHAENKYVGVPCGILDQGTSAFGAEGQLVHIDCRGPVFRRVPFPASAHLWIFNTREKHALVDGLYATRHRECTEAAMALGVPYLTDLSPAQLAAQAGRLAPVVAKRARHIVEEHARVHATVTALESGDLVAVGKLLTASHRSSQHLFENSTPALDRLVDVLEKHPAVYGARLTGGGFGGAAMALTRETFAAADAQAVAAVLEHPAATLHLQSADGARVTWKA